MLARQFDIFRIIGNVGTFECFNLRDFESFCLGIRLDSILGNTRGTGRRNCEPHGLEVELYDDIYSPSSKTRIRHFGTKRCVAERLTFEFRGPAQTASFCIRSTYTTHTPFQAPSLPSANDTSIAAAASSSSFVD